ncbi:LuxR C-terminal-related transcriptional regulator [Parafrankia irregularis]|uniref:LuxR C-terminal-related transcriptional regulator n=1 Tax=Parafrankia irregularis TaxID=795642 RepID=UPI0013F4BFD2|nr:LuxR C-terminal-related transcriptional regulator [Parafrankia irregularis]MBE3200267.1 GAF domain-containing protein [Parafrankia sp. CH37]
MSAHRQALAVVGRLTSAQEYADVEQPCPTDLHTLDGQLAILGGIVRDLLQDPRRDLLRTDVVELSQALHEMHTVRFAIHDSLGHERLRRLDALDHGLARLRRVTDQDTLLDVVCESAAVAGGFDRVMLSRVDDDEWRPWRSYSREIGPAERAFLGWMRETEPRIRLSHMLLENELVRRREPAIVSDASTDNRVYEPLARVARLASYVAAPIVSGERVIGILHADNRDGDVAEIDREILWFFATGFAQIFERSVLLARLRDQRTEVMHLLKSVEAALDELASSEIELASRAETTAPNVVRPLRPVVAERPRMLDGLLTGREQEVLALMATGATNERIARRLVIATDTVKSHVKQILRKLRVENRAEAIALYLRMTVGARED